MTEKKRWGGKKKLKEKYKRERISNVLYLHSVWYVDKKIKKEKKTEEGWTPQNS